MSLLAGLAVTADAARYEVKIENITTTQPFSPPLWAVHNKRVEMWSVGELASSGFLLIAEDAANAPLQRTLDRNRNVLQAETETGSPAGPITPGSSREFTVISAGSKRYLSMGWMLVRTNDAFSGLDTYKLNLGKGKRKVVRVNAYDAGTEENTNLCEHIPGPPCGNFFVRSDPPTADPIARHSGDIVIDVPGSGATDFGWTGRVAEITIRRTK